MHLMCSVPFCASHYCLLMLKHPNFPIVFTIVSSHLIPIGHKMICVLIVFETQSCREIKADNLLGSVDSHVC